MTHVKFYAVSDTASQLCRCSSAFPQTSNINVAPKGVSEKKWKKLVGKTRASMAIQA